MGVCVALIVGVRARVATVFLEWAGEVCLLLFGVVIVAWFGY